MSVTHVIIERMSEYSPWAHAAAHPHLTITHTDLPAGIAGLTDGRTIWISRRLTQAGRRCTLAHELVHIERGTTAVDEREERTVDQIAAARLIPLPALMDVARWTGCKVEAAEELWVDRTMLTARLNTLTPAERAAVEAVMPEWGV